MDAHCAVHMVAEAHPARIAIEQRREDLPRQRGGEEQGIARERSQDLLADLARFDRVLGKLLVVLRLRRLVAGRHVAVDPPRGVDALAKAGDLLGVDHLWNREQHRSSNGVSIGDGRSAFCIGSGDRLRAARRRRPIRASIVLQRRITLENE